MDSELCCHCMIFRCRQVSRQGLAPCQSQDEMARKQALKRIKDVEVPSPSFAIVVAKSEIYIVNNSALLRCSMLFGNGVGRCSLQSKGSLRVQLVNSSGKDSDTLSSFASTPDRSWWSLMKQTSWWTSEVSQTTCRHKGKLTPENLKIYLSIYLSIYLPTYLASYLSICLSAYLSISVYLSS